MADEKEALLTEIYKLRDKSELAKTIGPDYFEPGVFPEYLSHYYGSYDASTGEIVIDTEMKGTRYEGRTEKMEELQAGTVLTLCRDAENAYNPNNFIVQDETGFNWGSLPRELCNALAPFYDAGAITVLCCVVSFVDPVSKRSRHAKQGMLFAEMILLLDESKDPSTDADSVPLITHFL